MSQLSNYTPSVLALGTLMIAAAVLTVARPQLRPDVRTSTRFLGVVGLTILVQSLHFLEEWRTGLFVSLPETFGFRPFAESVFVAFNVAWLAIWVIALISVRRGFLIALFPLWFLGLGMVLNGLAHPILALRSGGYFPGLLTAPVAGVLGLLTVIELARATSSSEPASPNRI